MYWQEDHALGLVTGVGHSVGSRWGDHPRSVVHRRSGLKRHCQKLTVFCPSANSSATLIHAYLATASDWWTMWRMRSQRGRCG